MHTVVVEPLPIGWRVSASADVAAQYFLSGKSAEICARQLAASGRRRGVDGAVLAPARRRPGREIHLPTGRPPQ